MHRGAHWFTVSTCVHVWGLSLVRSGSALQDQALGCKAPQVSGNHGKERPLVRGFLNDCSWSPYIQLVSLNTLHHLLLVPGNLPSNHFKSAGASSHQVGWRVALDTKELEKLSSSPWAIALVVKDGIHLDWAFVLSLWENLNQAQALHKLVLGGLLHRPLCTLT